MTVAATAVGPALLPGVVVIGAGRVGAALTRRLLHLGTPVTVWNRSQEKAELLQEHGAIAAVDLRDAVRASEVVLSILADGPAVLSTLAPPGGFAHMKRGSLVIELSTMDQVSSRELARLARRAGVRFVRGALSGSPQMVEGGRASALLSGAHDDVMAAMEVLQPIVAGTTVVGPAEEAKVVKLAINGMVGSAVLAVAEAMVLIDAAGVERAAFVDALQRSAVWSPVVSYKSEALRDEDFRVTASTADLWKDLRLLADQQREVGVIAPATMAVLETLTKAIRTELRDADCISIVSLLRRGAEGGPLIG